MCGYVGFFTDSNNINYDRDQVISAMSKSIEHRGPDSDGKFIDENVSLGFRRLSIIDLLGGDQPQQSDDSRFTIVFNGEIYNYRELREMLINEHQVKFKTKSDTETILHTYEIFREKTASMLRGMFSFVIYDAQEKSLYGARDHFGIKPFYFTHTGEELIFGSEIKSFLHHPSLKKQVNKDALKMYLEFQYVPTKETMFKNVYRLIPGTYMTYKNGELKETRYFKPEFSPKNRDYDSTVKLIDEIVQSSVEYHQIADVEVGSFLSGGVDSSYIASVARPNKTYSVGFKIEGFDETNLAGELCKILNINNKKREISPDEFFDVLPSVQYHSDEPHANLSAVPLFFLSQCAAQDVKVVLSGEGADEFFAGYDEYIEGNVSRFYNKLPLCLRKLFGCVFSKFPNVRIRRFFVSNSKTVEESFIGQADIMDDKLADKIISEKYKSSISRYDVVKPFFEEVKNCDKLTKKMYLDFNLWLPYDILLKADKMTMAHSLELRVPFLDKEVWEVAKQLTQKERVIGRHTKRAFREAAFRHIPPEWANRKKAGFMVPFRVWIRQEKFAKQIRHVFNEDWSAEFFDTRLLNDMLDQHIEGKENNARVIYTVYSFLLWYEQYFIKR